MAKVGGEFERRAMNSPFSREQSIMGILNITEDSFSDGGCFLEVDDAIAQARKIQEEGAKILDIGAESTRPGARPIPTGVQITRLTPILQALAQSKLEGIDISVDTGSAKVAAIAVKLGARIINDISSGRGDPRMFPVVADSNASIILTHMRGSPRDMQDTPRYKNVVVEVKEFLSRRVEVALSSGIALERIAVDPGIGFGKTVEHNLELLDGLSEIVALGQPVVLGTSRKNFLSIICTQPQPSALIGATCATTVLGAMAGVKIFRVHDVAENYQALKFYLACSAQ